MSISMYESQQEITYYNTAANELSAARKNAVEALRRLETAEREYQAKTRVLLDLINAAIVRDFNDQTAPTIESSQVREHLTERRIVLDPPTVTS